MRVLSHRGFTSKAVCNFFGENYFPALKWAQKDPREKQIYLDETIQAVGRLPRGPEGKHAWERTSFGRAVTAGTLEDLSSSGRSLSRGRMSGLERQLSRAAGQWWALLWGCAPPCTPRDWACSIRIHARNRRGSPHTYKQLVTNTAANTVPRWHGAHIKDVEREGTLLCYRSSLHESRI